MKISKVALIPARSGSKRIPHKNVRELAGHPLIAYTITAAIQSQVFDAVICSTDSDEYAAIAQHYGADVPFLRSPTISGEKSPDIEWVQWTLKRLEEQDRHFDVFSILRPTSPFRLASTIQRAWSAFEQDTTTHSLRAIERCRQHPGKMWIIQGKQMMPLLPFDNNGTPWHSSQYASLPNIYVQDASLEIAWSRIALEQNSIAGERITPFISQGLEGYDINDPIDWVMAEHYLSTGEATLPSVDLPPYKRIKAKG